MPASSKENCYYFSLLRNNVTKFLSNGKYKGFSVSLLRNKIALLRNKIVFLRNKFVKCNNKTTIFGVLKNFKTDKKKSKNKEYLKSNVLQFMNAEGFAIEFLDALFENLQNPKFELSKKFFVQRRP